MRNPLWSGFYIFSVLIFMIHACLGWKKVTPVLGIPRGHIARVEILGTWVEVSQILPFFNVKAMPS